MSVVILPRRGTAAAWATVNPILSEGELGYETDNRKSKRGDGTTAWNDLPYDAASGGGVGTTVTWSTIGGKPTVIAAGTDQAAARSVIAAAGLDGSNKLLAAHIPDLSVVDYIGSPANEAAMLALTGQKGDWCIRTDTGAAWVITGTNPTLIGSWRQMPYPAATVTSVAALIHDATAKVTIDDNDELLIVDSAADNAGKRIKYSDLVEALRDDIADVTPTPTVTGINVTSSSIELSWTPSDVFPTLYGRDGFDAVGVGPWSGAPTAGQSIVLNDLLPSTVYNVFVVLNGQTVTAPVATAGGTGTGATVELGTVIPYSADEILNVKRGQYRNMWDGLWPQGYASQSAAYPDWPEPAATIGERYSWRQLQTGPSTYDWSKLDDDIADAWAMGMRYHLRWVSLYSGHSSSVSGVTIDVPDFVRSGGGTTDRADGGTTYAVPNWNNDTYLTACENLIAALGARYNKDERVEWVEFSGYGDYGECHVASHRDTFGIPGPNQGASMAALGYISLYQDQVITKANITRLVNAHKNAFPDTRIGICPSNPEICKQMFDANMLKPAGLRGDLLGVFEPPQRWAVAPDSWYVQNGDPMVARQLNRWRVAPVVTEWANFTLGGQTVAQVFEQALRDTVNYHVSLISGSVSLYQGATVMPAPTYAHWVKTNKYAGYRYAITAVSAASGTAIGTPLAVQTTWVNYGVAPAYDKWKVVYELRNDSNVVVGSLVDSSLNFLTVGAADQNYSNLTATPTSKTFTDSFSIPTTGRTAGTYNLWVRVVWDEHKSGGLNTVNFPPMNLAQEDRDGSGAYPVLSFDIE
jgi:hypothetical protein